MEKRLAETWKSKAVVSTDQLALRDRFERGHLIPTVVLESAWMAGASKFTKSQELWTSTIYSPSIYSAKLLSVKNQHGRWFTTGYTAGELQENCSNQAGPRSVQPDRRRTGILHHVLYVLYE